ncbi:MAG TPA: hypothetical protein VF759_03640 [Allosphingosinicella sp.]
MLGPAWWSAPTATAASEPPRLLLGRRPAKRRVEPPGIGAPSTPPLRLAASRPLRPAHVAARAAVEAVESGGARPEPAARTAIPFQPSSIPPAEPMLGAPRAGRSSAYGWAFLRPGGSAALAPGGTLGGSQAGLRLLYRLNGDPERPVALAARLASPIGNPNAAEAALGIDWRPSRRIPVHLLAERRQKLGREGRSAFALTVHGGIGEERLGPVRVDAYAQAGIVGTRARDLFADGALRLSLPVGRRARLGAGAWAAAQPGVARLDLGPQASLRLPLGRGNVVLAADWRLRVAGDARPGSGPALTLATDF